MTQEKALGFLNSLRPPTRKLAHTILIKNNRVYYTKKMALQTNKHYRDPALQSSEDSDSEEIFPPDILNDPSPTITLTHHQIQPTNQTLASKMAADMPVLETLTQKLTVSEPNLMKEIGEEFTDPYPKIDKEMLALYQNTEKILQTCYETTAEVVAIRKAAGISTAKMNNQTIFLPDHVTHELMQHLEQKLVDPFLEIQLKLVCPTAKVPSRSTKNGAFWDIFAPEKSTIQPRIGIILACFLPLSPLI